MNKTKFFSYFLFLISSFLLIYIFYKSEILLNGNRRNYYLIYYLFAISLLIFSIITFFLNKKIIEYFIIIFFSSLISLYIAEIYFFRDNINEKKKFSEKKYKKYNELTGKIYDKRSKFEVYKDLKKNNDDIKIAIYPSFFLNDNKDNLLPLSGASFSKTIYCNENGYYAFFESDRYGFNNPDSEWDQREIEYLIVGDSFGLGWCVNRPNDIGSVLRNLSNKSLLNLSYDSNGPLIEYSSLREYMPKNVKNVIWLYYERNDLENLSAELNNKILGKYLDDLNFSQNLKSKQEIIDKKISKTINTSFNKEIEKNKFLNKLKFFLHNQSLPLIKLSNIRSNLNRFLPEKFQPVHLNDPIDEFTKIIKLANDETLKNNGNLYFVYLPEYSRYIDRNIFYKRYGEEYNENNFRNYKIVKDIINKLNIDFIDIHSELFKKEANPLKLFPFEMNGHYNIEGYRKTAEIIFKFVEGK